MRLTKQFKEFFKKESASGILLIGITLCTIFTVNFVIPNHFVDFWKTTLGGKPLDFWVNDVLMTFFFLLVGLEIKRELYVGELSNIKQALLPILAAVGGMVVPAALYVSVNYSGSIAGFGIPMATDIAFSITILTILASRVPYSLKVFLTALAIIDDLGAIIIIAIFYTKDFSLVSLMIALAIYAVLLIMGKKGYSNVLLYLIPGIVVWILLYQSGIHPTITGVLMAFALPFKKNDESSLSNKIELKLHLPVAFFILPIFAIANTAIFINKHDFELLAHPNSIGILLGLVIGKPLGIFLFSWLSVKLKICKIFESLNFNHILGAGIVAGIGFTMSIFISLLAFNDLEEIKVSKLAVLLASLLSALIGIAYIRITSRIRTKQEVTAEETE